MTVSTRRSRAEIARSLLYNSSLVIGLMASIGISTGICGDLVTSVHAEDSKNYLENTSSVVETVSLVDKKTVETSSAIVDVDSVGRSDVIESQSLDESQSIDEVQPVNQIDPVPEQLKTAADVVVNADLTKSVVKETEAVVVTVDGQNVHKGMTLEEILNTATSDNEYVWFYLTSPEDIGGAGLTDAGAAAIMGCMQAESGVSTSALNYTDGGYGLLQWTDTSTSSRKSNLFGWCSSNGYDSGTLLGQLSFASHELKTLFSSNAGYSFQVYETLTSSGDIDRCLRMFFSHAEAGTNVPISADYIYAGHSNTYEMYMNRLNYAWAMYNEFSGSN